MASLIKNPLVQMAFALIVVLTIAGLTAATCIATELQAAATTAAGFLAIVALVWVLNLTGKGK